MALTSREKVLAEKQKDHDALQVARGKAPGHDHRGVDSKIVWPEAPKEEKKATKKSRKKK